MKLRYLVLDGSGQLRKAHPAVVRRLLAGEIDTRSFRTGHPHELKLVTAVCDADLLPRRAFLLRVPLTGGRFTAGDELALRAFVCPECVTPGEAVRHHLTGWPRDLLRQLAVALDVPVAGLGAILDIGGPVLVAAVTGLPIRRTLGRLG